MVRDMSSQRALGGEYDVVVVGAGHAGCEAGVASAKLGAKTLLITANLQKVATLPCNPSIGGPGKGHLVREIGALGGVMAEVADRSAIQIKQLNTSKGPAVRAYRAQLDKTRYNDNMQAVLLNTPGLDLLEDEVKAVIAPSGRVQAVKTARTGEIATKTVVICSGTFLNGEIIIGDEVVKKGGRMDEQSSEGLTESLLALGLKSGRLKTGTPPRIARNSIDFAQMEVAEGSRGNISFSYPDRELMSYDEQIPCYLTYTTPQTHQIILENLQKSPIFSGLITERAPRSCPSLDRKVANFPDKDRHPIFIEPEGHPDGVDGGRMYIQGGSLAFPVALQEQIIRSIPGLARAEFLAPGYSVVYDFFMPHQLTLALETKIVQNLFLAGQMNGTTGYEEAGAQGLMAGINASHKALGKEPFVLSRCESYIGVLIEDLVTKIHVEPYRMFTSRAEFRLLLRNDNADIRLSHYGYKLGLIDEKSYQKTRVKKSQITRTIQSLKQTTKTINQKKTSAHQWLTRPENSIGDTIREFDIKAPDQSVLNCVENEVKYSGYFQKAERDAERLASRREHAIPTDLSYDLIKGLRNEARARLNEVAPTSLAQAELIQGITPADLSILMVAIHHHSKTAKL